MKALEIWEKGMKVLPKELSGLFGPPVINDPGGYGVGSIELRFRGGVLSYGLINLPALGHAMLGLVKNLVSNGTMERNGYFLIAPVIYPKIAAELVSIGINFLDTLGNMYLNDPNIYILHTGRKSEQVVSRGLKGRMFSESGIRLLFGMLQSEGFLDLSYREAADVVGISPASISIVIRELTEGGWMYESNGAKVLVRKGELLNRWSAAYYEKLRPKLLVGTYQTRSMDIRRDFRRVDVGQWHGKWSGEAAANLYTDYLSPQVVGMFVPKGSKEWMAALKVLPAREKVELEVFRMFWNDQHPVFGEMGGRANVVPPILVYAELMGSNEGRNIETAKRIFDEYIRFTD